MNAELNVGIGQIVYANKKILSCPGVGSCVALGIRNRRTAHGGLAHIFLPCAPPGVHDPDLPGKFADQAVREMLHTLLLEKDTDRKDLESYLAGGAYMFHFQQMPAVNNIGAMNVEAVQKELQHYGIKVVFTDTGGHSARTVSFNCEVGIMTVTTKEGGRKVYGNAKLYGKTKAQ